MMKPESELPARSISIPGMFQASEVQEGALEASSGMQHVAGVYCCIFTLCAEDSIVRRGNTLQASLCHAKDEVAMLVFFICGDES